MGCGLRHCNVIGAGDVQEHLALADVKAVTVALPRLAGGCNGIEAGKKFAEL